MFFTLVIYETDYIYQQCEHFFKFTHSTKVSDCHYTCVT